MKAETARLLRAVLRLIEDDVRTWSEAVVEIDEREAAHYATMCQRLRATEDTLAAFIDIERRHLHAHASEYSTKVPS